VLESPRQVRLWSRRGWMIGSAHREMAGGGAGIPHLHALTKSKPPNETAEMPFTDYGDLTCTPYMRRHDSYSSKPSKPTSLDHPSELTATSISSGWLRTQATRSVSVSSATAELPVFAVRPQVSTCSAACWCAASVDPSSSSSPATASADTRNTGARAIAIAEPVRTR